MSTSKPQKILILGNACAGKTVLARKLAKDYNLSLVHVDSLQYDKNLQIRPHQETLATLSEITCKSQWIIDGYGPLDDLKERLTKADLIIFIDLPLWQHYGWACVRVLKNLFTKSRTELPSEANERNFQHIIKLFKSIQQIHYKMRPEMLRILNQPLYKEKAMIVNSIGNLPEGLVRD